MKTIGNLLWFVFGGFLSGLAWWLSGIATFSSRWYIVTLSHGRSLTTNASNISNWDAPVESSRRHSPRSLIVSQMSRAVSSAARLPISTAVLSI